MKALYYNLAIVFNIRYPVKIMLKEKENLMNWQIAHNILSGKRQDNKLYAENTSYDTK